MKTMLKKIISGLIFDLSRPKNLYFQETTGEYFIPCFGIPTIETHFPFIEKMDYSYNYCYRKIEVNAWGFWEIQNQWLGLNNPLVLCKSSKISLRGEL